MSRSRTSPAPRAEDGLHHGLPDRRRRPAAGGLTAGVAAVLDDHRDRDLLAAGAAVADEPGVRLGARGILRRPGLPGDVDPGDLRFLAGALGDDAAHHL